MSDDIKNCPFCGEEILATAKKCKYCGEWLSKQQEDVSKTKICDTCGETIPTNASICKHCEEKLGNINKPKAMCQEELPIELRRYNWGVFLTSWIWGLCNGMPKNILITMIVLAFASWIPFFGILTALGLCALVIWAGTQGNVWAWNNKNWESTKAFNDYQHKWVIIPLCIQLSAFVLIFTVSFFIVLAASTATYY